jgi:MFS family permease
VQVIGFVVATPSWVRIAVNFKVGELADALGRRPLMIVGALLSGAASGATGFAGNLPLLLMARAVTGLGSSMTMTGVQSMIGDLSDRIPQHVGKINAIYQLTGTMAFVLGPLLGGALAGYFGVRGVFYYAGATFLLCGASYSFLKGRSAVLVQCV